MCSEGIHGALLIKNVLLCPLMHLVLEIWGIIIMMTLGKDYDDEGKRLFIKGH